MKLNHFLLYIYIYIYPSILPVTYEVIVAVAVFSSIMNTFSGWINVPPPRFVSSVVLRRNDSIGPKLVSCLLLTGPRPGIKNFHSIVKGIVSGTSSCSMTILASAKVFDFRDSNFTKPTFLPGPSLELDTSIDGSSLGRFCFFSSFKKSSPSSSNSTIGLAHSFVVVVIASKAEFKFLRVGTCTIVDDSFMKGKPRGCDRGFDLDDDLSDEGRFTGETSLLFRFLAGGGTLFV